MKQITLLMLLTVLGWQVKAQCPTPTTINETGLALHYPFKFARGIDKGPNNLDAAVLSGTSTTDLGGHTNEAVSFSGTSYAQTSSNTLLNVTNQYTLSLWFNSTNIAASQRLIDKSLNGITSNYMVDIYQSKLRFFIGNAANTSVQPTNVLSSNTWYNVVATYDGTSANIYLNGALIGTAAATGNVTNNVYPFNIGAAQDLSLKFAGKLDEVRFYTRALSAAEAIELYELPVDITQPLSHVLCEGTTVNFSSTVSAIGALTYQWQKNGVNLADDATHTGSTTNQFSITGASTTDTGTYVLKIYTAGCLMVNTAPRTFSESANRITDNLVAYYPLNNNSGADASGNGYNMTLNTTTATTNRFTSPNAAVLFNGNAGGSVISNNNLNFNNQYTISCWIKATSLGGNQRIVDKLLNTTTSNFLVDLNNTTLRFYVGNPGNNNVQSSQPLATNTWYHIVACYDGTTAKLYVNNILSNSTAATGVLTPNTSQMLLGVAQSSSLRFSGAIDEVRLYNRALSTFEIASLYNAIDFSTQPLSLTNCVPGAATSFNTVIGNATSLQWYKDGVALSNNSIYNGVTNDTLNISSVGSNEFGNYQVMAGSNNCTSANSTVATLGSATASTVSANSLIFYQPYVNGAVDDVSQGHSLVINNPTVYAYPNYINQSNQAGWYSNSTAAVAFGSSNNLDVTNQLTLSCWFKAGNIATSQRLMDKTHAANGNNFLLDLYQSKPRFIVAGVNLSSTTALASNTWYFVSAVYDGVNMTLYVNGSQVATTANSTLCVNNALPLIIGGDQTGNNLFNGLLDEVRIYKRALSASEILTLMNLPTLSLQPTSVDVCENASVNLSVATPNTGAYYQWQLNGVDLVGATNATYNIASASVVESGIYTCKVYDNSNCNYTTSDTAIINISNASSTAFIVTQPQTQAVCSNANTAVSINIGNAPYTYQWYKDGQIVNGATTNTLNLANFSVAEQGAYYVSLVGACGTVHSDSALLTISTVIAASVSVDPVPSAICNGDAFSFSTTASGTAVTYQWYLNNNIINGANTDSYSAASSTISDLGNYHVVVSNTCGTVTSNNAALTYNLATAITSSPYDYTICSGDSIALVGAASGANILYSWAQDGNILGGATNDTLVLLNIAGNNLGSYILTATGACGTQSSSPAVISENTLMYPADGIFAYYALDGNTNDSGPNNFNTASTAVIPTADRNSVANASGEFNGSTSSMSVFVNSTLNITGSEITIAFWYYANSLAYAGIVDKSQATTPNGFGVDLYNARFRFLGAGVNFYTLTTAPSGGWHHVCFTVKGNIGKFYLDGVLTENVSNLTAITAPTTNTLMWIGARNNNSGFFNGKLDDVFIYRRALNDNQIAMMKEITGCQNPLKVNEIEVAQKINVAPNPTNGLLTINSGNKINKINVVDITGQLVISENINNNVAQLSLANLASGIYFVKANTVKGIEVVKVVKE